VVIQQALRMVWVAVQLQQLIQFSHFGTLLIIQLLAIQLSQHLAAVLKTIFPVPVFLNS
jgi:hypothetical protein